MALIEEEIPCVEVIHKKGDDFFRVLELVNEEEDPFDPETLDLEWTISNSEGIIVTISGSDITLEDNQVEFRKDESFFDSINFMDRYTHRLRDISTNTTLFEGKFLLK